MRKPFSFEVQVLDDRNQLRRFRSSNYQSKTRISNFSSNLPLALNCGWNQIVLNLADFTNKAYQTNYMETVRITVNANCRLKNIYFCDRIYSEEETPTNFKFSTLDRKVSSPSASKINLKRASRPKVTPISRTTMPVIESEIKIEPPEVKFEGNGDEFSRDDGFRPTSPVTVIDTIKTEPVFEDDWD